MSRGSGRFRAEKCYDYHVLRYLTVALLAACGSGVGSGPFGTTPGAGRGDTATALRSRGFCPPADLIGKQVTFPRCPQPGLELFISRVETMFRGDALERVSRVEIHASADQAMRRWHDLVRERTADGRERALAGDEMLEQKKALPDGAVSWVVWRRAGHLHAVILVRPPSRDSYEVVELLTRY